MQEEQTEKDKKIQGWERKKIQIEKRMSEQNKDVTELEELSTVKKRLMPKKGDFRMRAHINPFNSTPFPYPISPFHVDWKLHFPIYCGGTTKDNELLYLNTVEHPIEYSDTPLSEFLKHVDFVDVGCGYGGLSIALAKTFPDKLIFAMEIRDKLVNFLGEKIRALRIESNHTQYNNVSCIRTNAMRHITNYFQKGQLSKMFFCFPDPQFKKKKHRRRIINLGFLTEYAYLMKKGGRLYAITDVEELHKWHEQHLSAHKQFKKISNEDVLNDPCVELIYNETEEGKKVARNKGSKYYCVYERIQQFDCANFFLRCV